LHSVKGGLEFGSPKALGARMWSVLFSKKLSTVGLLTGTFAVAMAIGYVLAAYRFTHAGEPDYKSWPELLKVEQALSPVLDTMLQAREVLKKRELELKIETDRLSDLKKELDVASQRNKIVQLQTDLAQERQANTQLRAHLKEFEQIGSSTSVPDIAPQRDRVPPASVPMTNSTLPTPPSPAQPKLSPFSQTDFQQRVLEACGLLLPSTSGAPGAKDIIIISSIRRAPIDQQLKLPDAKPMDVQVVDADACFNNLSSEYVMVSPSGKSNEVAAVMPNDDTPLGHWLISAALHATNFSLVPGSECSALLGLLRDRDISPEAAWVEDEQGLSRCERDSTGGASVDPTKTEGYSGVIIVKIKRS
jgi:hypothetical protein